MGGIFGKTKKTAPSRVTEHDKVVLVGSIVYIRISIPS